MKKYTVEIWVNEEKLLETYKSEIKVEEEEAPSTETMIETAFGWLEADGISLANEPKEMKEWSGNRCSYCFSPLD